MQVSENSEREGEVVFSGDINSVLQTDLWVVSPFVLRRQCNGRSPVLAGYSPHPLVELKYCNKINTSVPANQCEGK